MSTDKCYYLTEDVLLDILIYLPVMSLLRFRAVCKYWCSLIESHAFISEHLTHNRDNREVEDSIIVFGTVLEPLPSIRKKFASLYGSQYEECVYDIDIGQLWYPASDVLLTGYCDGIVCLCHEHRKEIALWNPALKQVRPVPPPLFYDRYRKVEAGRIVTSFGIDIKSNDYKVVSIFMVYGGETMGYMIGNQVEVYNLRGDNSWRITHKDDVMPFGFILNEALSSNKNGMCFWVACCNGNSDATILLSFDFSDDVFRTMPLPVVRLFHREYELDLLDDKVVYMVHNSNGNDMFFDIWMLHEFGVEESWNMIYKLGPFVHLDKFFNAQISRNGEFIICSKMYDPRCIREKLYLYNLHTKQGKHIQNGDLELWGTGGPGGLIRYIASLVSLKKANIVRPT